MSRPRGIIEAIAELYRVGVIGSDGRIRGDQAARSARILPRGTTFAYVLVPGEPGIEIQQGDVRAIQLAKAALYAGARLLMEKLGIDRVDRIRLAGAFGTRIDVKYAMLLGMIPDCSLEGVSSAGNAAGTGARIALLDREARDLIARRAREVEKVETAVDERFQDVFVPALRDPACHGSVPRTSARSSTCRRPPAGATAREGLHECRCSSRRGPFALPALAAVRSHHGAVGVLCLLLEYRELPAAIHGRVAGAQQVPGLDLLYGAGVGRPFFSKDRCT